MTGTVTVGGPPRKATKSRTVRVLAGVVPARAVMRRSQTNAAARQALADKLDARDHDRTLAVFLLDTTWRVVIFDGWGRVVLDVTPGRGLDETAARRVANRAWEQLRALAVSEPTRWVWA